jgi:DNA-binding winged helix-turn-helix (wHTH) protein/tetratricopeptide (TPR) repeat protein
MEHGTIDFGPFRLDPAKRLLWREGRLVGLPPKAVDLLIALVEQAGEVVGKQELMDRVWPDTFVEEANLSVNVATIRKQLGDGHPYIETVSRRGYRFVGTVKRQGRLRLAVLPFRALGPETPDTSYLGLGLADAVISRLAASGPVSVRPTRLVHKYAGADVDPERAAQELQVDAVLEGTLQMDGTRVRVSVQMVPVREATTAWAERFEAERTTMFDLQDAIAERVARALEFHLGERKARRPNVDFAAYQQYVKGRYFWSRFSPAEMEKAFACFDKAAALDRSFALPHSGLAEAYLVVGALGAAPKSVAWSRARKAAERALALDDSLAEAHVCLGALALFDTWDWEKARQEFEEAVTLNPGTAGPHQWYALYLHTRGRLAEAQREMDRARELDPLSVIVHTQAALHGYLSGDHAGELAECEKAVELEPNQFLPRWSLGLAYERLGRFEEALPEHVKAVELSGGLGALRASVARTLAQMGREKEARAELAAKPAARLGTISSYSRVSPLVSLGDEADALKELERAAKERDPWIVWMNVDPLLAPLRAHARFEKVRERVFGKQG